MKLDEWIEQYNKRTPEPFKRDPKYDFFFDEDKGFCEVGATKDMVIINQLSGDGRFWKEKVSALAREIGAKVCGTWCIRSQVRAYIRLFGFKVWKEEELPDGRKRFFGIDKEGKQGIMSPAFTYENGTQAYFVTWEA
jgi:hypothetical protein